MKLSPHQKKVLLQADWYEQNRKLYNTGSPGIRYLKPLLKMRVLRSLYIWFRMLDESDGRFYTYKLTALGRKMVRQIKLENNESTNTRTSS